MKHLQIMRSEPAGVNKVRILADDLTGALDTAARFVPITGDLSVSWSSPPNDSGGAAFDTETRDLAEPEAGARIAAASSWLCAAEISYKKLDSQLRGPVAAEIAAAYRAGQFTHGVIAPAFPAQGRCTRNGRQWIQDPGASDWHLVGPDLVAQLEGFGLNVSPRAPSGAYSTTAPEGLTLWDAESDGDLDAVVTASSCIKGRTLWCGCAGLAGALARYHACSGKICDSGVLPAPLLFIVGTARPAMLRQISSLSSQHEDCRIIIGENTKDALRKLEARLSGSDVILLTFDLGEGLSEQQAGKIIRQRMRELLGSVSQPGSLFASGGETLHAALDILGAHGIRVDGEFKEGIPMGHLLGGRFDGVRLISKSGAFGTPDILVRIADAVAHI